MARAPRRLTAPTGFADVAAEAILLAGGGRALLLQLAHPAVARGVAEHSGFAEAPVRRLTGTLTYLYVLAFGTPDEVRRVRAEVGSAHRGVAASDGPTPYDARDPELQLWVAATLYDTTVRMAELAHGPLHPAVADAVYAQSARIGTNLGMPADAWPADRAAFAAYWARTLGTLRVGRDARLLAAALLRPVRAPLRLRAALPLARILTAGLLPPDIRDGYRVHWPVSRQRRYERLLRAVLAVYRLLPRAVRTLPSRLVLRRFRSAV
ncbi:MAG: hypothetical protein JWP66_1985 [Naasia sp.]|nr:hypothetical protein [Naasia sp.]